MNDTQDLVTAYTVKTAQQAEIVKNFLRSEGIACRIDGEGQIGLAGIMDIALLVHAGDADRARKLILQREHVERHSRG
jgi:Putative prokaryotic signal transducing protein